LGELPESVGKGGLTAGDKRSLFWRSLFLQSVWNHRGMQNVGFCFALSPLVRRLEGPERRSAFLRRHLAFFNTNPVLASYVVGAVAREEARGATPEAVSEIKRGLSGPLGMAGDALFWGSLRPFAGALAVALAAKGVPWAAAALLVVYDVPCLAARVRGVAVGAEQGPSGAREVLGVSLRGAVRWLRALTAFVLGLLAAEAVRDGGAFEPWRLIAVCLFFGLAYLAVRFRVPATVVGLGGAVGGIVLMMTVLNGG
jgi:PTS system mannose-specific IID component